MGHRHDSFSDYYPDGFVQRPSCPRRYEEPDLLSRRWSGEPGHYRPSRFAEITLPRDLVPGSLRVRPLAGAVISRVQTEPAKVDAKAEKALAALDERKEILGDRLKALETREEIFKAAAKSQSAKAPRKSKTNPEPVTAIRQGTDFALTRLEEVYRSRRATEKELKALEVKREELAKKANVGGSVARIWLQGRDGAVSVEYLVSRRRLETGLRFPSRRLADGSRHPAGDPAGGGAGDRRRSRGGTSRRTGSGRHATPAGSRRLCRCRYLRPAGYRCGPRRTAVSPLTFTLTGATDRSLPPGDGTCFWKGEYFGTVVFAGLAPGGTLELVCGRPPVVPGAAPAEKR